MMDKEKVNEELRRIFGTGRVEKIKWGNNDENSQWNKWTLQEKLEYAMELANCMNHAAAHLQEENIHLRRERDEVLAQVSNAEKALNIQKEIVFNNITETNEERQRFLKDIQDLQREVKGLRDGSIC
jgi:predicted  nucleic acid-binding Zn-ribbon protein